MRLNTMDADSGEQNKHSGRVRVSPPRAHWATKETIMMPTCKQTARHTARVTDRMEQEELAIVRRAYAKHVVANADVERRSGLSLSGRAGRYRTGARPEQRPALAARDVDCGGGIATGPACRAHWRRGRLLHGDPRAYGGRERPGDGDRIR